MVGQVTSNYSFLFLSLLHHVQKNLRKEKPEKEVAKLMERECKRNDSRVSGNGTHKERVSDMGVRERKDKRDMEGDRKKRKLGRDETNNKSSRARYDRSSSPLDAPHRNWH